MTGFQGGLAENHQDDWDGPVLSRFPEKNPAFAILFNASKS
jgi:hypothetical protein